MLHKQAKNYLLILKSVEISLCEIRSLLDYDRGQCADSSTSIIQLTFVDQARVLLTTSFIISKLVLQENLEQGRYVDNSVKS